MTTAFYELAEYLKQHRLRKNLSMREVAKDVDTSTPFYSNIENCRTSFPKAVTFIKLMNALGGNHDEAMAKYAAWKALSILEDSEFTDMSERAYISIFLETILEVLKEKYSLEFTKNSEDKAGKIWDFFVDLSDARKEVVEEKDNYIIVAVKDNKYKK